MLGAKRSDNSSGRRRAGESDHANPGVGDEGLTNVGSSGKHAEDALRHAGLFEDTSQHDPAGDGGARVGLQDYRVSERERGGNGANREDEGEVEGCDDAHDSSWHTARKTQPRHLASKDLAGGV